MYVYGPVPSRRLGRSLGVSPIPAKTCSYTCVYCQLGRTARLEVERRSFFPKEQILQEIATAAAHGAVDYVTFVGDGEPTLSADLGWLLQHTRDELHHRTAVITNGSLLLRADVRADLTLADVVMPTLDAGNAAMFRRVNRPHHAIGFDAMLEGLVAFRSEFTGELWLEVMLVGGLNDTEPELLDIKRAVDRVRPDRIYVLTPIRPPAEAWVQPATSEAVLRARAILGKAVTVAELETGDFGLADYHDARQAILGIGSRHPLREAQAIEIETTYGGPGVVAQMIAAGELRITEFHGERYLLPGHFKTSARKRR